jgi:hypothetical protein
MLPNPSQYVPTQDIELSLCEILFPQSHQLYSKLWLTLARGPDSMSMKDNVSDTDLTVLYEPGKNDDCVVE